MFFGISLFQGGGGIRLVHAVSANMGGGGGGGYSDALAAFLDF